MGRMFTLDVNVLEVKAAMFVHGASVIADVDIWHKRIGHVNLQKLKLMQSKEIVIELPKFKVDSMHKVCEACQLGKQARGSFPHDKYVSRNVIDMCIQMYGVLQKPRPWVAASIMLLSLMTIQERYGFIS